MESAGDKIAAADKTKVIAWASRASLNELAIVHHRTHTTACAIAEFFARDLALRESEALWAIGKYRFGEDWIAKMNCYEWPTPNNVGTKTNNPWG